MKKSLIVIAALILAMSVAGCGKKTENTNTTPQQTAQADASGAYENGSATETLDGQDYSKNVDMAAVEGTEAKSDTKADSYSGEVSNNDILSRTQNLSIMMTATLLLCHLNLQTKPIQTNHSAEYMTSSPNKTVLH